MISSLFQDKGGVGRLKDSVSKLFFDMWQYLVQVLLITTDIVDGEGSSSVRMVLLNGGVNLLPEKSVKLVKSGVRMTVMYENESEDGGYEKWIGKEIKLTVVMGEAMVYTVSFV